jgi:hypothetical protein
MIINMYCLTCFDLVVLLMTAASIKENEVL